MQGRFHAISLTVLKIFFLNTIWLIIFWSSSVATADITPPELVDLNFTPTAIDTSNSDQTVAFTWTLTDDLVGVAEGYEGYGVSQLRLESPSGQQIRDSILVSSDLVSGTMNNGAFETDMVFPQNSETGTWKITYVLLSDAVGNTQFLWTDDLIARGINTELIVYDGNADTDGDGLPDGLENITCTDPNNPDSDGDGLLDGEEDANHNGIVDPGETDPCDPNDPCLLPDEVVVIPQVSAQASTDINRLVTFDASLSSCYERIGCVEETRVCSYQWNFGGPGTIMGGNGIDTMVYQYDAVGDYTVSLTLTESITGMTASYTDVITAIEVEPPLPPADFAVTVSGNEVTLTAPILPAEVIRVYIYWRDRTRTVSTNPQVDLANGISHTYTRGGRSYYIRIMTIHSNHTRFNYTYQEDGDLSVPIP